MQNLMMPREDTWGIMKLQNCILHIAQYIDDLCEKNGIEYCLMGGSALGAVRHKGFIPWDDDLDIFMTPGEYEKFRVAYSKDDLKKDFYLQEWGQKDGMVTLAKLRKNESTLIEKDLESWDVHQGVYVDIFILHNCPDNKIKRAWQFVWAKYLVAKGAANRGYNQKKGLLGFSIKCLRLFPKRFLLGFALKQVYRYRRSESEYLCHFMGRAMMRTGLYKRSYFSAMKKVQFESIELYVPEKVEKYLRDRWGDYMKLPSAEEIKKFQHSWKWSEREAFPGYKTNNDYRDEQFLLA